MRNTIATIGCIFILAACANSGNTGNEGQTWTGGTGGVAGTGGVMPTGGAGGVVTTGGTGGVGGSGGTVAGTGGGGAGGSGGTVAGTGGGGAGGAGGVSGDGGTAGAGGTGGVSGDGGTAGTGGAGGTGGSTGGTFPRSHPADPNARPYKFQSYSSGFTISNNAFSSAAIYYPTDAPPPFAAVALCPGFTESKEGFLTWGEVLAANGIVTLVLTPANTLTDLPEVRGDELIAALDTIESENQRSGGPLEGKIDTSRLGVMGHSMGGGGTLFACNKASNRLRATVPLMPWQPGGSFPQCTAPTLLVAGQNDILVDPASMAYPEYTSLGCSEKVYMEVAGADHMAANTVNAPNNLYARYAISWWKIHLEDDTRYNDFIYGAPQQADAALFSKWEVKKP